MGEEISAEAKVDFVPYNSDHNEVWLVESPGIIVKPLTGYKIKYLIARSCFDIEWYGNHLGRASDLASAKRYAIYHLDQMLQMGYEA